MFSVFSKYYGVDLHHRQLLCLRDVQKWLLSIKQKETHTVKEEEVKELLNSGGFVCGAIINPLGAH